MVSGTPCAGLVGERLTTMDNIPAKWRETKAKALPAASSLSVMLPAAVSRRMVAPIHACESDRGVPGGGLVPWDDVFRSLAEVCPNARILMETYNTGIDGFGITRGIFKNVCPDASDFVREGLGFLKQKESSVQQ